MDRRALGTISASILPAVAAVWGCSAPSPRPPAPEPSSTRLIRCNYAAGDCVHSIDVDVALPLRLEPQQSSVPPPGGAQHAGPRSYEVLTLGGLAEVTDPGGRDPAPDVAACRTRALSALRASMAPPRPPREWHLVALAVFLRDASGPPDAADAATLLAWLEHAADARPLAVAMFPLASRLDAKQLAPLRGRDEIALRLVSLVSEAQLGSRDALREVLRLSLEYQAELPLFHEALRSIFPAAANQGLYAALPDRHEPESRVAFIDEVARRLGEARYVAGVGWMLEKRPS